MGRSFRVAAAALLLLCPQMLFADQVKLERLSPDQAPVEQRIASGQGLFWILERRAISHRGQTMLDGVIIVSKESGLKLKAVRRADGDQQGILGREGNPGKPVAELSPLVKDMKREVMIPYRLDLGTEIAAVYVPHGAVLRASSRARGVMIELEIREDKKFFEERDGLSRRMGM